MTKLCEVSCFYWLQYQRFVARFHILANMKVRNFFPNTPAINECDLQARVPNHLSSKQNRSQIISVEVTFWKKEIVKSTVHKTHLLRTLLFTKPCCRLQLHWKWTFPGLYFPGIYLQLSKKPSLEQFFSKIAFISVIYVAASVLLKYMKHLCKL